MNHTTTNPSMNIENLDPDEAGPPAPVPKVSAAVATLLFLTLSGAIAGVFLLGWFPKVRQHAALAEETHRLTHATPEVETMIPTPAAASVAVQLPGEIQAEEETVIFPRISGYLRKWHVDIGDQVKAGQLLAEIDTPEVDQQLQQAEATVEQLKARREVAETKLELARFTLERLQRLVISKAASQQAFDEGQAEFSVAQHQIKVADADIAAGMAELQRIKEMQSFAQVFAPFDGTITQRSIDLGQLVTSGNDQAQSLFRLERTDLLRVIVHVPQIYASGIKAGEEAPLVVRELPHKTFTGRVERTARAIDMQTRTMRTEIAVDNSAGLLLPGAYVRVQLHVERENPPLMVPASALIFNANGAQIAVVNSQDLIELRPVEVEMDQGTSLGISKGIEPGQRIVVNPGERLVEGMEVAVLAPVKDT
ncbi:efflux RND transporter periplasmic adaptor subunit [Blastopirellula sp. JC732]|uniref:Efflux RND transporter periplasmic adaptor subunit n=1 Tax=Blastopirellula sediminis TaxID=2894196 RepID=A0A9X1SIU7_9BACT|nr:efflux RND transporter periplasmic adaptor subunit [Blastopirellula sediminis]MCC9604708.1 efflux RND transporter periplasmic adaptor subunit [Blastopirellula sediminis]MCC9631993.1 efflux RND transporter periplasmic adaptor subunit [Blastopirellula sediminis]